MNAPLADVQRIVLRGSVWPVAAHLVLDFRHAPAPLHFLHELKSVVWPTRASVSRKDANLQVSLGFSRLGLQKALVPPNVMARFALKSRAFFAGAPLRASPFLGASGWNAPRHWDGAFGFTRLHAVLSLHAESAVVLSEKIEHIRKTATDNGVTIRALPELAKLPMPAELAGARLGRDVQYVYPGFLDGMSRVGIKGWTNESDLQDNTKYRETSIHEAGEFVLGYKQDCGANPWIAGPGLDVWPEELRSFFHNGSFGVLQQIEQYVEAFETFVEKQLPSGMTLDEFKAKLCGRTPDGHSLVAAKSPIRDDFDYKDDPDGHLCPFGSHVRRMNPRGGPVVEGGRRRALLRRGMPYEFAGSAPVFGVERGLIAHFFCASIEDQFEHLVGQWADRVPLGSPDRGQARDPLTGAHAPGDGVFEIPRGKDLPPLQVTGLAPFARTRGAAYLFYPSLVTLDGIADRNLWGADKPAIS